MSQTDDYRESNRRLWNAWTPYHLRSAFYDVAQRSVSSPK